MTIDKINHIEKALSRIITQYKKSDNLINYIKTLLIEADDIEDVLFQLLEERYLDKAVGEQLDILGEIVGQRRFNVDFDGTLRPLTDDEYRYVLAVRIIINERGITPEEIKSNIKFIFRADRVELREVYPAAYTISIGKLLTDVEKNIIEKDLIPRPLGVRVSYLSNFDKDVFSFREDNDINAKGFSALSDLEIGGTWASLI